MSIHWRSQTLKAMGAVSLISVAIGSSPVYGVQFPATADRGAPSRTTGGGVRGGDYCSTGRSQQKLTAIVPDNNVGTTTKADPTLFFFVPPVTNRMAEVSLADSDGNDLYQKTVALPNAGGIVRVQIPGKNDKGQALLETGNTYTWKFAIVCDAKNREHDLYIDGLLERVPVSGGLAAALKQAPPDSIAQAEAYAKAGVWQETLEILAKLQKQKPDAWAELLKSVGLEPLAKAPLAN